MNLSDYVINDIKPLLNTGLVSDLQLLFNQLTYSHIPIENEAGVYLGCISENDAHCFQKVEVISDCGYATEGFFVRNDTNWLDVLEAFAQNSTNIMPVLDGSNKYLGYYELNDIIGLFNETGLIDYSFSEISQIVESNDGKLYGAFISKIENDIAQITLKIGNVGLSEMVQTFRRYSYNIVSGHEEDSYLDGLKERSDYLNKYLNL